MNNLNMIGRLTAEPKMAETKDGKRYARYTVAVDRPGKDAGTDFIPCVVWNEKAAAFAEKYFHKGMRVAVMGSLMSGSYVKEDGSKVYTLEVRVSKQEFADGRKEAGEKASSEPYMDPDGIDDSGLPFN